MIVYVKSSQLDAPGTYKAYSLHTKVIGCSTCRTIFEYSRNPKLTIPFTQIDGWVSGKCVAGKYVAGNDIQFQICRVTHPTAQSDACMRGQSPRARARVWRHHSLYALNRFRKHTWAYRRARSGRTNSDRGRSPRSLCPHNPQSGPPTAPRARGGRAPQFSTGSAPRALDPVQHFSVSAVGIVFVRAPGRHTTALHFPAACHSHQAAPGVSILSIVSELPSRRGVPIA